MTDPYEGYGANRRSGAPPEYWYDGMQPSFGMRNPPRPRRPKPIRHQRKWRLPRRLVIVAFPPLIVFLAVVAAGEWGTKANWLSAIVYAVVASGLLWRLIVVVRRPTPGPME